uniref:Uncharacterized protein n=1 Tax=Kalanchoe fedtschenkoi TaxID=63787 RepID=A0A7N0U819_KALFE
MGSQGGSSRRSLSMKDGKKSMENRGNNSARKGLTPSRSSMSLTGERTVKRLRLSKAITVPDTITGSRIHPEIQLINWAGKP